MTRSIIAEILKTYVAPRSVFRRRLGSCRGEGEALAYLVAGCLLHFLAGLPLLMADAHMADDQPPFVATASGRLLGQLVFGPLALYGLAALARIIAHILGRQLSWYAARVVLFWSVLATVPLALLGSVIRTAVPATGSDYVVSASSALAFVTIWCVGMMTAAGPRGKRAA